jgi:uncharacterized membrane protein YgdD (TMEM256/DUF423 family)
MSARHAMRGTHENGYAAIVWSRWSLGIGGSAGCAGVVLGALAAHIGPQRFSPTDLAALGTASNYLLIHGLLLIALSVLQRQIESVALKLATLCAASGIICFGLAVSARVWFDSPGLGRVAPFGGVAFMLAWAACVVAALARERNSL